MKPNKSHTRKPNKTSAASAPGRPKSLRKAQSHQKRKTGWAKLAVPAYKQWLRPKAGKDVSVISPEGDPTNKSTRENAILALPTKPSVGPMFIQGFISSSTLTAQEREELQAALGKNIREQHFSQLEESIDQLIGTVALEDRLPAWESFDTHLKNIITAGTEFLKLMEGSTDYVDTGVLAPERVIRNALILGLHSVSKVHLKEHIRAVQRIIDQCKTFRRQIRPRKSRPGSRGDEALRRLMEMLVAIAYLDKACTTIPPNENAGPDAPKTPLFYFARLAVKIAAAKGRAALDSPRLSAGEKRKAADCFEDYSKKTGRALIDQLRKAKSRFLSNNPDYK